MYIAGGSALHLYTGSRLTRDVDAAIRDVHLLSQLDLTVSKPGRFSSQDREDIRTLARSGLINADALRQRAEEALGRYIGNLDRLRGSIDIVQGHRGALKHNCRKGRRSDLSLALTETGRSDASRRARNTAAAPNTYDA